MVPVRLSSNDDLVALSGNGVLVAMVSSKWTDFTVRS